MLYKICFLRYDLFLVTFFVVSNYLQQKSSRILQNSIKIIQNRPQNDPKMRSGGCLADSRAALGRILGGSWASSGSKALLGSSSWAVLEASWARFGRLWGRLGHQVGTSWRVLEATWKRLSRIFALKWNQVGIKID